MWTHYKRTLTKALCTNLIELIDQTDSFVGEDQWGPGLQRPFPGHWVPLHVRRQTHRGRTLSRREKRRGDQSSRRTWGTVTWLCPGPRTTERLCHLGLCVYRLKQEHAIRQECIPVGCIPPALYRTRGGGSLPDRDLPPPVNKITDRCKNITFPQLRLRAVIKAHLHVPFAFAFFVFVVIFAVLFSKLQKWSSPSLVTCEQGISIKCRNFRYFSINCYDLFRTEVAQDRDRDRDHYCVEHFTLQLK